MPRSSRQRWPVHAAALVHAKEGRARREPKARRGLTIIILHDVINLDELQVMDTVVLPWIEETYGEKDIVTASNK